MLCYLPHWTKFNQILCVSHSHEWGLQQQIFFGPAPWGPGEGSKGQISFNLITKSVSKIFIPNFVCVLTNVRFKTNRTGFFFCRRGNAQGVGLWGAGGAQGVKSLFFSNMVMWHIKKTGWRAEQNASKNFILGSKLVTLGWGQKVKYP